jgi:hypothetical protein
MELPNLSVTKCHRCGLDLETTATILGTSLNEVARFHASIHMFELHEKILLRIENLYHYAIERQGKESADRCFSRLYSVNAQRTEERKEFLTRLFNAFFTGIMPLQNCLGYLTSDELLDIFQDQVEDLTNYR